MIDIKYFKAYFVASLFACIFCMITGYRFGYQDKGNALEQRECADRLVEIAKSFDSKKTIMNRFDNAVIIILVDKNYEYGNSLYHQVRDFTNSKN